MSPEEESGGRRLRKRKSQPRLDDGEEALEQLLQVAAGAQKIVVFSGSGLSASSGMSTFSTRGGLYERAAKKYRLADGKMLFTYAFFDRQRPEAQAFFADIYGEAVTAEPAAGHHALRQLYDAGRLHRHYTLNIDGLAEQVGMDTWHPERNTSGVTVEMHGNVRHLVCPECHTTAPMSAALAKQIRAKQLMPCSAPECSKGMMRFKVMMYDDGEAECITPDDVMDLMEEDVKAADLVLWVGISFQQSASTAYFRSVRCWIQEAGRLSSTVQALVNPSDEALFNLRTAMSNQSALEVLEVLAEADEALPMLADRLWPRGAAAGGAAVAAAAARARAASAAAAAAKHEQHRSSQQQGQEVKQEGVQLAAHVKQEVGEQSPLASAAAAQQLALPAAHTQVPVPHAQLPLPLPQLSTPVALLQAVGFLGGFAAHGGLLPQLAAVQQQQQEAIQLAAQQQMAQQAAQQQITVQSLEALQRGLQAAFQLSLNGAHVAPAQQQQPAHAQVQAPSPQHPPALQLAQLLDGAQPAGVGGSATAAAVAYAAAPAAPLQQQQQQQQQHPPQNGQQQQQRVPPLQLARVSSSPQKQPGLQAAEGAAQAAALQPPAKREHSPCAVVSQEAGSHDSEQQQSGQQQQRQASAAPAPGSPPGEPGPAAAATADVQVEAPSARAQADAAGT